MQDEAIFKVPKTRRCLLNLFCKETLEDLDDVWNAPNLQRVPAGLELDNVNLPLLLSEKHTVNNGDHLDSWPPDYHGNLVGESDTNTDKYTIGLMDELNDTPFNQESQADGNNDDIEIDVDNIMSPKSPDILLVKDESMANIDSDSSGSDVDWDSFTPPVPSSPSDHVVPDQDDLYWNSVTLCEDHIVPQLELSDFQNFPSG
ncbi:uncharacterized protein LOC106057243 [Biomphalaria glabrata]|uniref:Uncharacterized protein LOC106057243 n=1 Tax=Biomphalaria glabrata TaxID=6526 RepID=A0A9U8E363_BIOGL|nr:uncharacterized protein LOC106057243 [Biomphalaria glabrata]